MAPIDVFAEMEAEEQAEKERKTQAAAALRDPDA